VHAKKPPVRLALALQNAPRLFRSIAENDIADHPVDVAVSSAPRVAKLARRLRQANKILGRQVKNRRIFIAQQDTELAYRMLREESYFAAGYTLGVAAGRSEPRLSTRQTRALAKRVRNTALLARLPRDQAAAALLEGVRAIILPVRRLTKT
jgi:hypothetical protein